MEIESKVSGKITQSIDNLSDALKKRLVSSPAADKTLNFLNRSMDAYKNSNSILKKMTGAVTDAVSGKNTEKELFHRELVNLLSQVQGTTNVINQNKEAIEKLVASGNKSAEKLLPLIESSNDLIKDSYSKVLNRENLTSEEATKLVATMTEMTSLIGDLDTNVSISMSSVAKRYAQLVSDKRIEEKDRIALIKEVIDLKSVTSGSNAALDELSKINLSSLTLTDKNSSEITTLLERIAIQSQGVEIVSNLGTLNEKIDKSVLTQTELTTLLTKKLKKGAGLFGGGQSFGQSFQNNPGLYSKGQMVKQGLTQTVLSATGLGFLDNLGATDWIADKAFGGAGKVAKGAGRLGAKAGSGILGKVGGMLPGKFGAMARVGAAGLSNIGGVVGEVGSVASKTGGIMSRVTQAGGGILSKVGGLVSGATKGGGIMGKVAGAVGGLGAGGALGLGAKALRFAKFAGPIGLVATGLSAGIDAFKGFDDKKAKALFGNDGFMAKMGSSLSSAVSGFTFGLVKPETIAKGLTTLGDSISSFWDSTKNIAKKVIVGAGKIVQAGGEKLQEVTKGTAAEGAGKWAGGGMARGGEKLQELGQTSKENLTLVAKELKAKGFNEQQIKASLGNVMKETGGISKSENLNYKNQSPEYIRSIFKSKTKGMSDEQINAIKKDPEKMADMMYGGKMGNTKPGEGFKYRGRGLVQLTGKSGYEAAGKALGIDLVNNPDLANDPAIAAKIAAWHLDTNKKSAAKKLGVDVNSTDQRTQDAIMTQAVGGNALDLNKGYGNKLVNKVSDYSADKNIAAIAVGTATTTGAKPKALAGGASGGGGASRTIPVVAPVTAMAKAPVTVSPVSTGTVTQPPATIAATPTTVSPTSVAAVPISIPPAKPPSTPALTVASSGPVSAPPTGEAKGSEVSGRKLIIDDYSLAFINSGLFQ